MSFRFYLRSQLVDAKEAGYLSTNNPPQGEIYLRGPSVTGGYFKRPDLNEEVGNRFSSWSTRDRTDRFRLRMLVLH